MKPDPSRARDLFLAAAELPPAEREAYLVAHCDSQEMRAAVDRLLAAHDDPASVLRRSAPGMPTAEFTAISERPGTKIGPYVLRELLGEGGFGLVFVAEQMEPVKRKVALKVIKPGMDTRHVIARFEQERQALAMMDHPNIARVLDAGSTESGRPYFVMELVRGIPITDYCDQNHLEPNERLHLFTSVCHAIQHAHQKGVIHRDVKPSNVLVTSHDGKPVAKVIDFGVAKAIHQHLTERTIYTNFAQMIGTPLYMSPEQAEMSGLDIDTRSDIYSLGVLLYELLTGTTPIEKKRIATAAYDEIRRVIREEEPPKPSQRISTASETLPSVAASRGTEATKLSRMMKGELDWVVMKALEKDRTRRYETANGLAMDVQRYLTGEPVSAVPPSASYQMRKFLRRHKGSVVTAAVVLVGLMVGIAGTSWGLVAARKAMAAERIRAEAEQQAKQEALAAVEAERQARQEAQQQRDRAGAAEQRAIEEANAAKAVRDFLTDDLLRQAAPMFQAEQQRLTGGNLATLPNPTVVEVLDRAAARVTPDQIGKRFPNMALVQAGVLKAVGDSYRGLLLMEKAEPFLTRAVQLYRECLGPDDPQTMDAEFQLADVLFMSKTRSQEGRTLHRQVLERRTRLFGPFDDRTLTSRRHFLLAELTGLYDFSSQNLIRQMIGSNADLERLTNEWKSFKAELVAHFGPEHPQTIYATYFLGMAYRLSGKIDAALAEFDACGKVVYGRKFRIDHPDVETAIMVHVGTLRSVRRDAEAVKVMENALAMREEQRCAESPIDWQFRHQLGWSYMAEKKYDDALRVFQKNAEKAKPPEQDQRSLESMGSVLRALKRHDEARQYLQKALDLRYARNGTAYKDWDTGRLKSTIGHMLLDMKKFAEAETLMLAGYKEYQDHKDQMPPYNRGHMEMAAWQLHKLYKELDKPAEAAKWKAEAEKLRDAVAEAKSSAKAGTTSP
jgi:serine/threonine protein kinase/tetratricopeptide (TPR) repeat protein